jgi:sporulation integral membrane protein YtvI
LYIKPVWLIRWVLAALIGALALWLSFNYLLPWFSPFITAFLLARLLEPAVKLLCRRGWKREFASGVCTLSLLAFIVVGLGALLSRGLEELGTLSGTLPEMFSGAGLMLRELRTRTGAYMAALPPEVTVWLGQAIEACAAFFAAIPAALSRRALDFLSMVAMRMPSILLFTVTCGIGVYFISAAYPGIQGYLDIHLPEVWQRRRLALCSNMRFTLGRYARAQLILMVITFFELLFGFMLLRVDGSLVLSAAIAFLDALPVLGAGAVLLPWGLCALLTGDGALGLGLLILWGVISLVRNCIQAKLVGDQLGLPPLITLMAIYIGWCAAGVWGMVLFPMLALVLKQLDLPGHIRRYSHG